LGGDGYAHGDSRRHAWRKPDGMDAGALRTGATNVGHTAAFLTPQHKTSIEQAGCLAAARVASSACLHLALCTINRVFRGLRYAFAGTHADGQLETPAGFYLRRR